MLFRNKKNSKQMRTRQPDLSSAASTPVFSYHARSAQSDKNAARKVNFLGHSGKSSKPRPRPRGWTRRAPALVGLILLLALAVSNSMVSNDPQIIILSASGQRGVSLLSSEETYRQAAQAIIGSSLLNTNKLTFDSARIAQAMQDQFAELDEVSATLPMFGRRPVVYIYPADPALLIKTTEGELFVVGATGRALVRASQVVGLARLELSLVEDQSGLKITLGRTVLPSDNINFITEVLGQLKAKNIKVTGLLLPKGASELDVRVENQPYTVKFSLKGDAREEAGAFLATKQYLERQGKTPAMYIDVRVDNKTYYR